MRVEMSVLLAIADSSSTSASTLREAGADVTREYRAGKWPQLEGQSRSNVREFLLEQLLERCPGYSTRDYRRALNGSLTARRKLASGRSRSDFTRGRR